MARKKKEKKKGRRSSQSNPAEELAIIRKKMGLVTFEKEVTDWLDTGSVRLNSVLGSAEKGLAFGKMLELSGPESNGKTLLMLFLAGLAQKDGACVGIVDLENSYDASWAKAQGLDPEKVYLFKTKLVQRKKKGPPELETTEELLTEVEHWMAAMYKKDKKGKLFIGVDSVASMLVREEEEAGLLNQNMRTKVSLAAFLSQLTRRWAGLAPNYNAMIVFINQLRTSPAAWGNPERTPGGRALKFHCAVRAYVRRLKGGRIMQSGKVVGLKGSITNMKNKTGAGSLEGIKTGFRARFRKRSWRFLSADKLKREER